MMVRDLRGNPSSTLPFKAFLVTGGLVLLVAIIDACSSAGTGRRHLSFHRIPLLSIPNWEYFRMFLHRDILILPRRKWGTWESMSFCYFSRNFVDTGLGPACNCPKRGGNESGTLLVQSSGSPRHRGVEINY